jgi:rRNA maturation endonuclease Nob1
MVRRILESIPCVDIERYRCGLCDLRFDRERPNCPACGGPVRRE